MHAAKLVHHTLCREAGVSQSLPASAPQSYYKISTHKKSRGVSHTGQFSPAAAQAGISAAREANFTAALAV
jgi:hypothetical protein